MPRKTNNRQRRIPNGRLPQLRTNVVVSHTYRFVSTSGTATTVTNDSVIAALGNICTVTNTSVSAIAQSFHVRKLTLVSPPASQGASATCSVEWLAAAVVSSTNMEVSDTTVSVAVPACVVSSPPANSNAAFWQTSSTNGLFILTAPVGTVIDLAVDYILVDDPAFNKITTVATGVLGTMYYLSLDPNATHRYTPVSLTTTF